MVDSRYLVLVDSRYLVLVDIQISVTEARAAGLVQLIVFMYSSNRRPGPLSCFYAGTMVMAMILKLAKR